MRGRLLLGALLLLAAAACYAKRNVCDEASIAKMRAAADKAVAAEEHRLQSEISATQAAIEALQARLAAGDPACARETLDCAATIEREQSALRRLAREMPRRITKTRNSKAREVGDALRRCARAQEGAVDAATSQITCNGGRCKCPAGRKLATKPGVLGEPQPDGCSVPGFITSEALASPLYDEYLHQWHQSACHAHDTCYCECGRAQGECDAVFKRALEADCDALLPAETNAPRGDGDGKLNVAETLCPWLCTHPGEAKELFGARPTDPQRTCAQYVPSRRECHVYPLHEMQRYAREDCRRIANLFAMGVSFFGTKAYADAQQSHCRCVRDKDEV